MKTLKPGATGSEVTTLQELLRQWQYPCPVTGVFDNETEVCP